MRYWMKNGLAKSCNCNSFLLRSSSSSMALRMGSFSASARGCRSEDRRVGSDWSSDVCSSDLLDEERLGEVLQLQLVLAPVQLFEHGLEDGVFLGIGAGLQIGRPSRRE